MSFLDIYLKQKVSVLTNDGRVLVGLLEGFDNKINLILNNAEERVFSLEAAVETIQLGLYILRGDSIAIVGLVDSETESSINWEELRASPLKPITYAPSLLTL
ncbi:hypothetical protein BB561_004209 [Smittium simulii]|uniref:LSM2-LSM8 complex subunit LSM8 n=1 Tax=Smittium simulii TaxID=133385 RepID=A0A2T9YHJ4_9FUNG|nr:hypothetical protein BB561_004209 [Smittium simulii]